MYWVAWPQVCTGSRVVFLCLDKCPSAFGGWPTFNRVSSLCILKHWSGDWIFLYHQHKQSAELSPHYELQLSYCFGLASLPCKFPSWNGCTRRAKVMPYVKLTIYDNRLVSHGMKKSQVATVKHFITLPDLLIMTRPVTHTPFNLQLIISSITHPWIKLVDYGLQKESFLFKSFN